MPRPPAVSALRDYVTRAFGIDLRAMAAFRIALGLTALGYSVNIATDLRLLFTGDGVAAARLVWPVESIVWVAPETFYAFADSSAVALVLLIALGAASSLLVLGMWPRAAAFVVWLTVNYFVVRNPWLTNAQHSMLLFSLLWSMFLPIGARWSMDAHLGGIGRGVPQQYVSPATAGLLVQIFFLYLTAGIAKSGPEWHANANAIEIIGHLERYQTPFSPLMLMLPSSALALLTRGVWWLEVCAPFVLFSPVYFATLRTAAGLCLIGLHLGLGVFMNLGIFPWVCMSFLMVTLPTEFWDRLVPRSARPAEHSLPTGASPATGASMWRRFGHALAALLLVSTLMSYLRIVPGLEGNNPAWMRTLAGKLRLGHRYRLFSSVAPATSRMLVVGTFESGRRVDLLSGRDAALNWNAARLSIAPDEHQTFMWVYYTVTASGTKIKTSELGNGYAGWMCDAYQDAGLQRIEIHHFVRTVPVENSRVASQVAYEADC